MAGAELTVKLMAMTPDAVDVVYSACRQCYSPAFAGDEFGRHGSANSLKRKEALIRKVVASGHESPLEHVSLTFAVRGISRSCSHQLVRHRLASYSQQSQRYVDMEDFGHFQSLREFGDNVLYPFPVQVGVGFHQVCDVLQIHRAMSYRLEDD